MFHCTSLSFYIDHYFHWRFCTIQLSIYCILPHYLSTFSESATQYQLHWTAKVQCSQIASSQFRFAMCLHSNAIAWEMGMQLHLHPSTAVQCGQGMQTVDWKWKGIGNRNALALDFSSVVHPTSVLQCACTAMQSKDADPAPISHRPPLWMFATQCNTIQCVVMQRNARRVW